MAQQAAKPGKLRLAQVDNQDPFPDEMRRAIAEAAKTKNSWHIELSIAAGADGGAEPNGLVRFKHNFPDGMREFIKKELKTDDWSLQMRLVDGDGDGLDASGDDDGTAHGFDVGPMASTGGAPTKTAANNRGRGAKSVTSHSRPKKAAPAKSAKRASSRSAAKTPRSTSKKRGKR